MKSYSFDDINIFLPKRKLDSHKGKNGRVLVVGGSEGMGGAGIMASEACLYSGAGLVSLYTHKSNLEASLVRNPEIMTKGISKYVPISEKLNVLLFGPGLKDDDWSNLISSYLDNIPKDVKVIVDAGGFKKLKQNKILTSLETILTPHPGEASNLLDVPISEIQDKREYSAKAISKKFNASSVILKGNRTLIYIKDTNETYVCENGGPELSTGGTGDVLSGVISGLVAQGLSTKDASLLSVAIHAKAGEIFAKKNGEIGLNASALIPIIRKLLNS